MVGVCFSIGYLRHQYVNYGSINILYVRLTHLQTYVFFYMAIQFLSFLPVSSSKQTFVRIYFLWWQIKNTKCPWKTKGASYQGQQRRSKTWLTPTLYETIWTVWYISVQPRRSRQIVEERCHFLQHEGRPNTIYIYQPTEVHCRTIILLAESLLT